VTVNIVDLEVSNYETAEQALADWTPLQDPEVLKAVERAAWSIASKYENTRTIEREDAYQEGLILVATHPALKECFKNPDLGLGALYTRLVQRLTHKVETEARHRSRTKSYEANLEALGGAV